MYRDARARYVRPARPRLCDRTDRRDCGIRTGRAADGGLSTGNHFTGCPSVDRRSLYPGLYRIRQYSPHDNYSESLKRMIRVPSEGLKFFCNFFLDSFRLKLRSQMIELLRKVTSTPL